MGYHGMRQQKNSCQESSMEQNILKFHHELNGYHLVPLLDIMPSPEIWKGKHLN